MPDSIQLYALAGAFSFGCGLITGVLVTLSALRNKR